MPRKRTRKKSAENYCRVVTLCKFNLINDLQTGPMVGKSETIFFKLYTVFYWLTATLICGPFIYLFNLFIFVFNLIFLSLIGKYNRILLFQPLWIQCRMSGNELKISSDIIIKNLATDLLLWDKYISFPISFLNIAIDLQNLLLRL